jgi:GDP-L-fucose synthase
MELSNRTVYVAGHRGMAGSALVRRLSREGVHLVTASRSELDLTRQAETEAFISRVRPDLVIVAAAKVGGIKANADYPADFIAENLSIELNLIRASAAAGVPRLLFLGSTCIYPRLAPQPMPEDAMLTGPLEPTNEWYAVAKIAGVKLCQAYRKQFGLNYTSVMPTNLYGPGDNYHPDHSHVVAALIRRFAEAKWEGKREVIVWGTGRPRREFLFVDDFADACLHILKAEAADDWINIGVGEDISVADFARLVADVVGFSGQIRFDPTKPDGTPRKLVDISKLKALGWQSKTRLLDGMVIAYRDFAERFPETANSA